MIGETIVSCDAVGCVNRVELPETLQRVSRKVALQAVQDYLFKAKWFSFGVAAYCPEHVNEGVLNRNLASQISEKNPEVRRTVEEACASLDPERREMVDHPAHYGGADNPYEAIKVIDAWRLDFALGNCVKYIARAKHKGSELEDLRKARWYLDHAIKTLVEKRK